MVQSTGYRQGQSFPLGATVCPEGVNFSVFSRYGTALELLLFEDVDDLMPSSAIALDPRLNRTYYYWHVFVPGITAGQLYGYRVHGPFEPEKGHRFNPVKVLLDPYGKCMARPDGYNRAAACKPVSHVPAMKSVVVDSGAYDWGDDVPLRIPFARSVLYELHVGGFTKHPTSGVAPDRRGTYAGLIEKIPYLHDLGVTAVELLPVHAFDEQDCPPGLTNYWGYSPISFFAPHAQYSSRRDPLGVLDEFRDMVKALHATGLEVILDVVYNHTAEGGEEGPTLCYRGLANDTYYILESNKAHHANYTGCGNTLNANESICRRLILDSLRYWVSEMHVDGFRFDLASILSRDEQGVPMPSPPVLWDIESDPVLANVKLIAEAWDAAGLYQVGHFPGESWKEWNGRYRDDVRSFLKGDKGMAGAVAHRLLGSPDIYQYKQREPEVSINFVTCHDGFTLNDLVSYNDKHNEANRETNRDGADDNRSWNCGAEGPTDDPHVERLRNRQVKNFLALTLLSAGTPMLLMGDEVRRSQGGNNNAYCQNNETSWFDWSLVDQHADVKRFTTMLIALRVNRDLPANRFGMTLNELLRRVPVQWHGVKLNHPGWSNEAHILSATLRMLEGRVMIHVMVNAYWEALDFEIPPVEAGREPWRRCIDTFLDSPDDICDWADAPVVKDSIYSVRPRSVALLIAKHDEHENAGHCIAYPP
jgi:glycogen operon protein